MFVLQAVGFVTNERGGESVSYRGHWWTGFVGGDKIGGAREQRALRKHLAPHATNSTLSPTLIQL